MNGFGVSSLPSQQTTASATIGLLLVRDSAGLSHPHKMNAAYGYWTPKPHTRKIAPIASAHLPSHLPDPRRCFLLPEGESADDMVASPLERPTPHDIGASACAAF